MTVHIGEITSEVVTSGSAAPATGATGGTPVWDEAARVERLVERVNRDRLRTATGHGDD
jgi:hypothetical protein